MQTAQFAVHADIENDHWWFVARRSILRALLRHLVAPSRSAKIIDVGCGTGGNIGSLAAEYDSIGIDPSAEAIAYARERYPQTRFICGRAPEDLGGEAARADVMLLTDVLEHIEDDRGFLSALVHSMRPGALLLITVPAEPSLWNEHDVTFGHFRRYVPDTLRQAWQGLPVEEKFLSYCNAHLYPVIKIARMISRLRKKSLGRAGTDLAMPPFPLNTILQKIFASESSKLIALMEGRSSQKFRYGVSLVAVLQRTV